VPAVVRAIHSRNDANLARKKEFCDLVDFRLPRSSFP
jgi:hypothetical protein